MKKIITLVLMLVALCSIPLTSYAEKDIWKEKGFNFKQIKTINVSNITINELDRATFQSDVDARDKVYSAIHAALDKRGVKVSSSSPYTVNVTVHSIGKYIDHKAAYDTEETVDKKEVGKDEHGKDIVVTVPTKQMVHHPAEDIWHAVVDINFNVYYNGREIYTDRDCRERAHEDDTSGMLGRICKDFAKNVTKN